MQNRRNYYRLLHVQPDAPLAVIKASYRTIMQKLKQHPDLGGDDWNAALINEAYAVLSNVGKRTAYDEQLLSDLVTKRTPQQQTEQSPKTTTTAVTKTIHYCPFCRTPHLHFLELEAIETCVECQSPLKALDTDNSKDHHQRALARMATQGKVTYFTYWPQSGFVGAIKDLSPTGLRFLTKHRVFGEQHIKIVSELFDAVVRVVNCQPLVDESGFAFAVGAEFVTVAYDNARGVFVSVDV